MTDNNGWIKIHRKMLDNPVVMKDASHLAVWVYLLMNATHKEYPTFFGGKKIVLKPGELIISCLTMSKKLDISEPKVRRILELFKNDEQIDERATNEGRLISILSWDKYQITDERTDERLTNDRRTTDERPTNLLYNKNIRMEEYKNNNIYISDSDSKNSEGEVVKPSVVKPEQSDDARKYVYEKALREAIRYNDRSSFDRVSRIAKAMGCELDVRRILEEEKANGKKEG